MFVVLGRNVREGKGRVSFIHSFTRKYEKDAWMFGVHILNDLSAVCDLLCQSLGDG